MIRETVAGLWRRWLRLRRPDGSDEPATAAMGRWGEEQAAAWLRREGYRILGRRVRPGGRDEIDLVVRHGEILAFVEVKTRRSRGLLAPSAAIDRRKKRALGRAAARYLRRLSYPRLVYRFDVVEVIGTPDSGEPAIRHIRDAFRFGPRVRFPG